MRFKKLKVSTSLSPPPPQKNLPSGLQLTNVTVKWEITLFRQIYKRNMIYPSLCRECLKNNLALHFFQILFQI